MEKVNQIDSRILTARKIHDNANDIIVRCQNCLNRKMSVRFNAMDMNIFFSIIYQICVKGTNKAILSYSSLKKLSRYNKHNNFTNYLKEIIRKLQILTVKSGNETVFRTIALFTEFEIDQKKQTLTVSVNSKVTSYFNELKREFTQSFLSQYTSFSSSYSKTAFCLIEQYRTIGKQKFSVEEFRYLLAIPESYRISDIDRRVLKIIKEEVTSVVPGLCVNKNRDSGKRGLKVVGYTFTWKPEIPEINHCMLSSESKDRYTINNIKDNSSLSKKEKCAAIDRIRGVQLGTTLREETLKSKGKDVDEDDTNKRTSDLSVNDNNRVNDVISVLSVKKEIGKMSNTRLWQLIKRLDSIKRERILTEDEQVKYVLAIVEESMRQSC